MIYEISFTLDKNSSAWLNSRVHNIFYLRSIQNFFNDKLKLDGIVYATDVLDFMDIKYDRRKVDRYWCWDSDINDYITFYMNDSTRGHSNVKIILTDLHYSDKDLSPYVVDYVDAETGKPMVVTVEV